MAARDSRVEIGYLEKTEPWKLESRFFPSKVGGKPAWLDLKNIDVDIGCGRCSKPCIFLCQLYAPLPEANEDAHHRTIYVFACKNPDCFESNDNSNFVAYRCQLPMSNEFYSAAEPEERQDWCPEARICNYSETCVVCGCFAPSRCSNCKKAKYCSRDHQATDWKSGHNKKCGSSEEKSADLLFPEFEIISESELLDEEDGPASEEAGEEEKLKDYKDYVSKYKDGSLGNVDPKVLEELAFGKEDKYFKKFRQRLKICSDQVIRYERGGEPLWIAEPNADWRNVPNCETCNGPRVFEFQILPTLLNSLNVDSLDKSIDWGVLLVFTCEGSCRGGPSYKREFLLKQDVVD